MVNQLQEFIPTVSFQDLVSKAFQGEARPDSFKLFFRTKISVDL